MFASLSNVLGQWDNLPSPVPTDIKEYKLYDVETKYGLLQVRILLFPFSDLCRKSSINKTKHRFTVFTLRDDVQLLQHLTPPPFVFFKNVSVQISEGLSFLHSGVKMVHGNLCLENIILNKSGSWKIMGFDFSISSTNASDAVVRP